jgi:deoxyribodipyrimidine photo-lyase
LEEELKKRGIKLLFEPGTYESVAEKYGGDAAAIYTDKAYLRENRSARQKVASSASVSVFEVEDNVISPVETTSSKEEYAARTIRPKIDRELAIASMPEVDVQIASLRYPVKGKEFSDRDEIMDRSGFSKDGATAVSGFPPGETQAMNRFRNWLEDDYGDYADERSDPLRSAVSVISPYLHFGILSPHQVMAEMSRKRGKNKDAFLEEMIVRRELAVNFVYFNRKNYDSYKSIPEWASKSLEAHKHEKRKVYTRNQLLEGRTHDPFWNECMLRIKEKGFLHNHLRMYWGKGFLRYTNTPSYAYSLALEFNNTYFLDGNDPNSFANIAWIFGKHDRAFGEREIFGKVRTMTAKGLKRKMPIEKVFSE